MDCCGHSDMVATTRRHHLGHLEPKKSQLTQTVSVLARQLRFRYENQTDRKCEPHEIWHRPHLRHNLTLNFFLTCVDHNPKTRSCRGAQICRVSWSPANKCDRRPGKTTTISITKSSETESVKAMRSGIDQQKSPSAEGSRQPEPAQKRKTETAV